MVSDEEYEDVKKLYLTLKMTNLSDLNALYNFHDAIILAEIFENRARIMHQKFRCNPLNCSFASTLSGANQRVQCKCILAYPTNAVMVELMEKTLIGGMSIVNTRLGFDCNLFLNESRQQKLIYTIRNRETNETEDKWVSAVILKMDENNQYGNAMTKPLPTGCIKREKNTPSIRNLCFLLMGTSHLDAVGHLFVVDIEFDSERATEKELFFNEIYCHIFEKKKVLEARE